MSLKLIKQNLTSRAIRQKVVGKGQIRVLDLKHEISRSEDKNFLDKIGDAFNGLGNFLSGALKIFAPAGNFFVSAFSWLIDRTNQLKAFNWNASDKELEALMDSQNLRIATAWGSALGRSLGWIAGIGIGYGVSFLCPVIGGAALARTVATNVGKEAIGEITNSLSGALNQTVGALANNALISGYINYRRLLKSLPDKILGGIYGKSTAEFIKKTWGGDGQPNLSFNSKMEEFVESIQNDKLRAFVDAFLEESWDGFTEAGIIVAYELDSAYAQAKRANEEAKGKRKTVRLTPDNRKKTEQLLLSAGTADLEEEVLTTLNNYRLIANRDVGQIVGMPADDYLTAKPLRRQLVIVFKTKKEPPWRMPDGTQAKKYEVTIPDADLGLTWAKIKLAAKPYTWGKFRATAHLDNGRQMAVYGASKSEAEKTLRRLVELSTAKILALNVTEEVEKKNPNLRKEAKTVYPAYATLLVRRPTTGEGRNFTDGSQLEEDRIRLDLWTNEAPKGIPPLK
jgi:hypothetical protein